MSARAIEADVRIRASEPLSSAPLGRMAIALLALGGLFVSVYLLLFELGVIGTLVCGVGGGCHTVQTSSWAVFLGMPVPVWGVVGYALLFGFALAGLQPRFANSRGLGLALLGLGTAAFAFSAYLTGLEAFVIRAWCRWCLVSAALATLIFACSLAEMPRLRRSSSHARRG